MNAFFQWVWGLLTLSISGEISTPVWIHLKKVHISFYCTLVASFAGVLLEHIWNIGGYLTALGSYEVLLIWSCRIPPYKEKMRVSVLMIAALINGPTIGLGIESVITNDLSNVVSILVGIAWLYGCYSVATMLTQRRKYLYLGGLLSSCFLALLYFAASLFDGYMAIFEMLIGLVLFMVYEVLSTEEIIELAHHGDHDYVKHAAFLYSHFAYAFICILISFSLM